MLDDSDQAKPPRPEGPVIEVDHVVIGAGISGICVGHYLKTRRPKDTFVILEGRDAIGGTWDLFRFPGVRSDSDMFTLGYGFRPWSSDLGIAEGGAIRDYVEQTAEEGGYRDRIALGHRVLSAEWSSEPARWTVAVEAEGARKTYRSRFLFFGTGYYEYDQGYLPDFPGRERFKGAVVHPQAWPEDLSLAGKRVAVIGSGATAVTLVPAIAEQAAHVVMVQRTPSFIGARPKCDPIARRLRKALPERLAHRLVRWKNILGTAYLYRIARRKPDAVRAFILKQARAQAGPDCDVETHFNPPYQPWDQRFCLAPDGDIFAAIARGRASVVTSAVTGFTEQGLRLENGEEVAADVVVTATGLKLRMMGGVALTVDGKPFSVSEAISYKGAMLSGLPNAIALFGYTNASWTLKCELVSKWAMRLLDHLDRKGFASVTPRPEAGMAQSRFMDLTSGYVTRSEHLLPKQGDRKPWVVNQNYFKDIRTFSFRPAADEGLVFERAGATQAAPGEAAAVAAS